MSLVVLIAYALGGALGLMAARISAFGRVWPHIIRTQTLLASVLLSIAAAWRLNSLDNVLWPVLMVLVFTAMLALALMVTKGENAQGRAVLHTWAATANTGFWVIPVGAALGGSVGALVGVLFDRLAQPLWATYTHLLRRNAPFKQRKRTSFIDQAPMIALGIGLLLHLVGPAPEWTATMTLWAAPIMAATGSAIFVGSVLHPSQRIDPRPGVRTWLAYSAFRLVFFVPLIVFAPSTPIRIVTILGALTIPTFGAPQVSTLYGYADPVVAAASRYAWFFGAIGLIAAVLVAR